MSAPVVLLGLGLALVGVGVLLLVVGRQGGSGGLSFGSIKVEGSSGLVLVLVGAGLAVFSFVWEFSSNGDDGDDRDDPPADTDGDTGALDELWVACDDGDMAACDELFFAAPVGSEHEEFGMTCGWRIDTNLLCTEEFP